MDYDLSPIEAFLIRVSDLIGPHNVLTTEADKAGHLSELRKLYQGASPAILKPGSTDEVAAIMKAAHELSIAIVPQGGNTGLVGGQIPDHSGNQVVLSLARLNRIRDMDPAGNTMIVEAGCVLENVHRAADSVDRLFPLTLGSMGSCQIGGNLATNAGGTAVLAYGNTRDLVLGLEVVLADGRIWNGLRRLRKDNTGYDLKNLFVGAEGTLGIITAAVLKLFPKPAGRGVAFVAVATPEDLGALFDKAKAAFGSTLTGFEVLTRNGLDIALAHLEGARDPLGDRHPWYALLERNIDHADGDDGLEAFLLDALQDGLVTDGSVAQSGQQADAFWHIRHGMSEAQRRDGGAVNHDVSVPIAAVPAFLRQGIKTLEEMVPGCRPNPFGHFGDGNIHFNVSPPRDGDASALFSRRADINEAIHSLAIEMGGSFSAEHGIGRLKRDLLRQTKDPVELDLMASIKRVLDPKNLLNPGKVL
ncbi:MAG: FAD-binding oxidoreductase [Pseudomonadota bacterium]